MGLLLPGLVLLLTVSSQSLHAQSENEEGSLVAQDSPKDDTGYRVTIAEPFIELHTGPGAGYPVYYVIDRGSEVRIIRRKTDWFRIESKDGKTGWASREQMRETLLPSGEKFKLVELGEDEFEKRKWVFGLTGGEFDYTPVFTVFTGYSFTENLTAEAHFGQSVGSVSSSTFFKSNLVMQPLPDLKYSPYLTLGLGKISIDPGATLIAANADADNSFAQFGLGVQRYISRSFLFRFEVNEYVIFSATSTRDNNEEISEWKFGFAVFF